MQGITFYRRTVGPRSGTDCFGKGIALTPTHSPKEQREQYPKPPIPRNLGKEARPMRVRWAWSVGVVILGVYGLWALSGTQGQDRPTTPLPQPAPPPKAGEKPARDLSKLTPLQRQMDLCLQRGAEWLYRANKQDGRFIHGFVPA